VSSVIIHDTDDEQDDENNEDREDPEDDENQPEAPPEASLQPPPRTRKAKDTQRRLGVGKPALAGGSGPRAVTKSLSVSRSKKALGGRSIKPSEATIFEEGLSFVCSSSRFIHRLYT
jgi:hypothetical protein